MAVPKRVRKAFNVLLCLVAIAGIGCSSKIIWQNLQSRRQIDAACAGLVPAGRVLALSGVGGDFTHTNGDEGTIDLNAGLPQACELSSARTGEQHGSESGKLWFFTGVVGATRLDRPASPEAPTDNVLHPGDSPIEHAYPPQPLGGGITGVVTDSNVTVHLPCAKGMNHGQRVGTLWALASLADPLPDATVAGQLTPNDRDVLAQTAVITANRLADRLGCDERLPDAPDHVPAPAPGPTPASGAHGTCDWYRRTGLASRSPYPDQVLEARVDDTLWDERCVLVLSPSRAATAYDTYSGKIDSFFRPHRSGAYFAAFHTYSGDTARHVDLPVTVDPDDHTVHAEPGKAGRDGPYEPVWWASSLCDGEPQIHTLTLPYGYDTIVAPAIRRLFRTYVDAVTHRRHCTDVTFPSPATFRRS